MTALRRPARLTLTDAQMAALHECKRDPPDEHCAALAAVLRSPAVHLELTVDDAGAHGWLDEGTCALAMRRGNDELEVLLLARARAATALAALSWPDPETGSPAEVTLTFTPGDLALVLAGRDPHLAARKVRGGERERAAARALAADQRRHWLLEAWPADAPPGSSRGRLEGVSTRAGTWLVRPSAHTVTLQPANRTQVEELLERLLTAALRR